MELSMPCYLLHFSRPLAHARHYAGFSEADVEERVAQHVAGRGARITQVAVSRGIELHLVRIWPKGSRKLERKLKDGSLTDHCPLCRAASIQRRVERKRILRARAKGRHDADCSL